MFTCTVVPSVEYYLRANPSGYYTDSDAVDRWWAPAPEHAAALGCKINDHVEERRFRALCLGKLDDGRKVSYKKGVRRPGFDLHFAPPKSVSIVANLADPTMRGIVLNAHDNAVRKTLDYIHRHGYFRARRGHAGAEFEPAQAIVAAIFRELTSRQNDPQLHSHCVVPNIGVRGDGTIGALNNEQILRYQKLIGALYNAELASGLRHAGFSLVRKKRTFEIAGVPSSVIKHFSKRRAEIEEAARAAGIDPASDRAAAQVLALRTRPSKVRDQPAHLLAPIWRREAEQLGFKISEITLTHETTIKAPPTGEQTSDAIDAAFSNSSVLKWPHLLANIAEQLQLSTDIAGIEIALPDQSSASVLAVGDESAIPHRRFYSTPKIAECEKQIVRDCLEGRGKWSQVAKLRIEEAIASLPTLSDEQKDAIRHALNDDTVTVVEGSAGAGKSFALSAVAQAARAAKLDVLTLAPSWTATKVVARDTNTSADSARALTGFLASLEAGKISLGLNTVVILDEAGMVGTIDMGRLVSAVSQSGAKLVLSGDTEQLKPVSAGAPLLIVSRAVGSSRMTKIRRQVVGWQRDASELFARGMTPDALEAYDRRGNISWTEDASSALTRLADRYIADLIWDRANGAEPAASCLAIASWNEDVRELNHQIRVRLRAARLLSEDKLTLSVAHKDGDEIVAGETALGLAIGDRIAFAETLTLPGRNITNADTAVVLDASAVSLTVRFDDGQVLTAVWKDLVGRRAPGQPQLPLIKHVFAATVHFSQGMTVDRCYVAAVRPMHRDSMYVAMTRHRHNAQLFVDASRFDKSGLKPRKTPREHAAYSRPRRQLSSVLQEQFFQECGRPNLKVNVSDFAHDPVSWVYEASASIRSSDRLMERLKIRGLKGLKESSMLGERSAKSGMHNDDYRTLGRGFFEQVSGLTQNHIQVWITWLKISVRKLIERPTPEHYFWHTFSKPRSVTDALPSPLREANVPQAVEEPTLPGPSPFDLG